MTLDLTIFPELTTNRLRLRRLMADDAPEIRQIRSDKTVNEYLERPASITIEEAGQFIQKINAGIDKNESVYWAISRREENTLIGTACYWNIDRELEIAEMGYELHPLFQGKGYMQEAIAEVMKYGFEKMKLRVITALPMRANSRSIRVLEKNNFRLDENNEFVNKEAAAGLVLYYRRRLSPA